FLLMNGLFLFLSQELGLGSPIDLLGCAALQGLAPSSVKFSEEEYFFLREYDQRAGLEPLQLGEYMVIPPTRLICLIHPELMSRLAFHLNPQAMTRFQSFTRYSLANGSNPQSGHPVVKRGIIDTHFHLDSFFGRQNQSLSDLEHSESLPIHIPFAIANYVFPKRWHLLSDHVRADPRLRITLGVHPHMITNDQVDQLYGRLKGLLDTYPESVGVGEVGLDLTTQCRHGCYDQKHCCDQKVQGQRRFLRLAFQIAKETNKVLVLHIRDSGTGEAAEEVLGILREMDMLQHPIHRHCFVGKEKEYIQWYTSLPNCYFSLSPVTVADPITMSALRTQDFSKRILLESDSRYLGKFPWSVHK
ncbi:MAG: TatD family hydrolase, partial [Candidatus Thiodiazotropha endolucinida]|nr:TatD family hydrolase [Candidatus Thiodiazotropha taylori]MCW4343774.1 TatD family hydrolase [Candidatus Thiodiazotropha endolucinida]